MEGLGWCYFVVSITGASGSGLGVRTALLNSFSGSSLLVLEVIASFLDSLHPAAVPTTSRHAKPCRPKATIVLACFQRELTVVSRGRASPQHGSVTCRMVHDNGGCCARGKRQKARLVSRWASTHKPCLSTSRSRGRDAMIGTDRRNMLAANGGLLDRESLLGQSSAVSRSCRVSRRCC